MKPNQPPSIRTRLVSSLLAISLFFAALTGGAVWLVMNHEMNEMMNGELRESGELLYHIFANSSTDFTTLARSSDSSEYDEHLAWQLIDSQTKSVVAKSRRAPELPMLQGHIADVQQTDDGRWYATTFRIQHPAERMLIVAQSSEERVEAKQEGVLYALLCAIVSALLAMLLLNWRIKKELQPLVTLAGQVKAYDPLSKSPTLHSPNRQELQPIEESIRELGDRLAQRVASDQAFIAHAAHALRTPVAGIEAQLAVMEREVDERLRPRISQARRASQRLRQVMQALLSLFRSGLTPKVSTIDLRDLINEMTFPALTPSVVQGGCVTADPDLLAAVLFNLVDNSHTHKATIASLQLVINDGWQHLFLTDDGEGCPDEKLIQLNDALLRRDYRPDSGLSGLGLVLADLVMHSHHGHVRLHKASRGFCVELCWPVSGQKSH